MAVRPDELKSATMARCRDEFEAAWTFLEWRGKRIYLEYLSTSHFFPTSFRRRATRPVAAHRRPRPPVGGPPPRPRAASFWCQQSTGAAIISPSSTVGSRSSSSVSVSSLLCFLLPLTWFFPGCCCVHLRQRPTTTPDPTGSITNERIATSCPRLNR